MSVRDATTFTYIWVAHPRACKKCLVMNGYVWVLPSYVKELVHPVFGIVYDVVSRVSLLHPYCHCSVEVQEIMVDLEKVYIG